MITPEQILPHLAHRPLCQWVRPDDKEIIKSDLTISDYNFLIGSHKAKPILFHLSMLNEEVEIGGRKIIVIDELEKLFISVFEKDYLDTVSFINNQFIIDKMPVSIYNQLLKWHFNVTGIEDENVVYVTKEFNPYK